MQRYLGPGRLTQQPRFAARIDPSHPLARGLIGFWYPVGNAFISAIPGVPYPPLIDATITAAESQRLMLTTQDLQYGGVIPYDPRYRPTAGATVLTRIVTPPQVSGAYYDVLNCLTQQGSDGWSVYSNPDDGTIHATVYVAGGAGDLSTHAPLGGSGSVQVGWFYDAINTFGTVFNGAVTDSTPVGAVQLAMNAQPLRILANAYLTPSRGKVEYIAIWSRALSSIELASFNANPYQMMQVGQRRLFIPVLPTVTVTGASTEPSDTSAAAATLAASAAGSFTEDTDTSSAAATVAAAASTSAAGSYTEDADTSSASGVAPTSAAGTTTEAPDSAAGSVSVLAQGQGSYTEQNDAQTGGGSGSIQAVGSSTLANDTSTGAATVRISATSSTTQASDTSAGAATLLVTGSASLADSDDVLVSEGAVVAPSSAAAVGLYIEAADTAPSAATLLASGSASVSDVDDTLTSAGAIAAPSGVVVSGSVTDTDDALLASGTITAPSGIVLVGSVTDQDDVLSSAGTVTAPVSGTISAIGSVTDPDDVLASAGTVTTPANVTIVTGSVTDQDDTLLGSGAITAPVSGTIAIGLLNDADDVLVAAGSISYAGRTAQGNVTEQDDTLLSTGVVTGPAQPPITLTINIAEAVAVGTPANQASVGAGNFTLEATADRPAIIFTFGSNKASV
jgi:hypothetical protein